MQVEFEFHRYVRPTEKPLLSDPRRFRITAGSTEKFLVATNISGWVISYEGITAGPSAEVPPTPSVDGAVRADPEERQQRETVPVMGQQQTSGMSRLVWTVDFCKELTGIQQEWVEEADTLDAVLRDFYHFLEERSLVHRPRDRTAQSRRFVICTDGPSDLRQFLEPETRRKGFGFRGCWHSYVNVRRQFANAFGSGRECSLQEMLSCRGMSFDGRPHCGLHDSRNIARLVVDLLRQGHPLMPTSIAEPRRNGRRPRR
ncbi:ERI1 [Symbiodinium sp. CCMP2592]|nr:ERI1 [Symbiodinium sp. CCMP2592]